MTPGSVARRRNSAALFRVLSITGEHAELFGGPRWQRRTLPLAELVPATAQEAARFERAADKVRAALRQIPAGRPIR